MTLYLGQLTSLGMLRVTRAGYDLDPFETYEVRDAVMGGYYLTEHNIYLADDEVLIVANLEE